MLGLATTPIEAGDAEILNPPIAKSTFMRSTSKGKLSSKETPPLQKYPIVNSGYSKQKPSSVMDSDSEIGTPVSIGRK